MAKRLLVKHFTITPTMQEVDEDTEELGDELEAIPITVKPSEAVEWFTETWTNQHLPMLKDEYAKLKAQQAADEHAAMLANRREERRQRSAEKKAATPKQKKSNGRTTPAKPRLVQ